MKVLSGHYSPETAFVVEDYPYGFTMRCKIRYWLEVNSKGTRFWSQTTNPKKGNIWNTPKASTYSLVGVMIQKEASDGKPEEDGHIGWSGMSAYDVSKCRAYLDTYKAGMTTAQVNLVTALADGYDKLQARKSGPITFVSVPNT
jgi:hypothetical protein